MTGAEFRSLLEEAGFDQVGLAKELSRHGRPIHVTTVSRWCNGHLPPHPGVVAYLKLLIEKEIETTAFSHANANAGG